MKNLNSDNDLGAPCPAQASSTRAGGPDSLLVRSVPARCLAGPARRPVRTMAASPAAFKGLPYPLPWQVRIRPAWTVLTGRIGTMVRTLGPVALAFLQA